MELFVFFTKTILKFGVFWYSKIKDRIHMDWFHVCGLPEHGLR